jgi:hypothetical protein
MKPTDLVEQLLNDDEDEVKRRRDEEVDRQKLHDLYVKAVKAGGHKSENGMSRKESDRYMRIAAAELAKQRSHES